MLEGTRRTQWYRNGSLSVQTAKTVPRNQCVCKGLGHLPRLYKVYSTEFKLIAAKYWREIVVDMYCYKCRSDQETVIDTVSLVMGIQGHGIDHPVSPFRKLPSGSPRISGPRLSSFSEVYQPLIIIFFFK